ncbi:MAG: sensor domain-containing diguanylate cyclase, partial [Rhodospirillales bacterium]|nr:sensor domain-containing diguanylate cyclase [Rhodospirillales bacterium]
FYEGIAEDISQRKMFEDVGDEVNDKFRSIFDNAVEGIYQAAPGGEFIGVNPALARMLGYEHPDDLAYGTFIHEFFLDRGMAEHFWNMLVEDGEVRDFEALSRRHDGSEIWLRHNARSIRTPWDEVQYCEGTIEDITDRKSMEAELMRLATTDPLTGTMNRREFMEAAERELHRARRHDRALSVLMLDADHFKSINDTYGHNAGDETLRQLAASARQSLRDIDVIGRLGGEEFAILLPEEGLEGGRIAAERLRAGMSQLQLMVGSEIVRFTVSIGVAELSPQDKGIDDLLRRSDQALYRAKNNGRNRVEVGI